MVTTFAGSGTPGSADGTGTTARFDAPLAIAARGAGEVVVGELTNATIRRIAPSAVVIRAAVGLKLKEQALANQMRQAQVIQQSLVPPTLPTFEGYDIAAASVPADDVGGDVYDVQEVEQEITRLLVQTGAKTKHGVAPKGNRTRGLEARLEGTW